MVRWWGWGNAPTTFPSSLLRSVRRGGGGEGGGGGGPFQPSQKLTRQLSLFNKDVGKEEGDEEERALFDSFIFVMQGRKRRRIQRRIQRRRNTHAKSTGSRLLGGARRRRRRSIQDVFWFRRSESHRVCGVCILYKTELHWTNCFKNWFLSVSQFWDLNFHLFFWTKAFFVFGSLLKS